jgi:WD40 repeat protein
MLMNLHTEPGTVSLQATASDCVQRQHADDTSILKGLPLSQMYERSFMHRDTVTHVATSTAHDFIITGSSDGDLRFWKIISVSPLFLSALVKNASKYGFNSVEYGLLTEWFRTPYGGSLCFRGG